MLPIHWATFVLGFHPWAEPAERAMRAAAAHDVALALPAPGRRVDIAEGGGPLHPVVGVRGRPRCRRAARGHAVRSRSADPSAPPATIAMTRPQRTVATGARPQISTATPASRLDTAAAR